jgi:hypothetical protein
MDTDQKKRLNRSFPEEDFNSVSGVSGKASFPMRYPFCVQHRAEG